MIPLLALGLTLVLTPAHHRPDVGPRETCLAHRAHTCPRIVHFAAPDPLPTTLPGGLYGEELASHPIVLALYESLGRVGLVASDVTSVVSGPHCKDSAHFSGRALDVGSVSGVAVGDNVSTIRFLVAVIAEGATQKIGSELAIIRDPRVVAAAALHGVELFRDDKSTGATGPHLHIETTHDGVPTLPAGRAYVTAALARLNLRA